MPFHGRQAAPPATTRGDDRRVKQAEYRPSCSERLVNVQGVFGLHRTDHPGLLLLRPREELAVTDDALVGDLRVHDPDLPGLGADDHVPPALAGQATAIRNRRCPRLTEPSSEHKLACDLLRQRDEV
jgi:hypothetical protein